jgi:hypothetical protein
MNGRNQKFSMAVAALGVAAGLTAMFAWAGGQDLVEAEKAAALTVHIDGHGGGSIAKKLNEMHAQMAPTWPGWPARTAGQVGGSTACAKACV